jgi:hypothetical protein
MESVADAEHGVLAQILVVTGEEPGNCLDAVGLGEFSEMRRAMLAKAGLRVGEQLDEWRRGIGRVGFGQERADAVERGLEIREAIGEGSAGRDARVPHGREEIRDGAGSKGFERFVAPISAVREEETLDEGLDFGIGDHVLMIPNCAEPAQLYLDISRYGSG